MRRIKRIRKEQHRIMKIVTKQLYIDQFEQELKNVKNTIPELTIKGHIQGHGIEINQDDALEPNITLDIDALGVALGADYKAGDGSYCYYYTSALVLGTILLSLYGVPVSRKSFRGYEKPTFGVGFQVSNMKDTIPEVLLRKTSNA